MSDNYYGAGQPITANTTYPQPFRAIHVGTAGNIKCRVKAANGTPIALEFRGLAAGSRLPVKTDYVYIANTTATWLVGLY